MHTKSTNILTPVCINQYTVHVYDPVASHTTKEYPGLQSGYTDIDNSQVKVQMLPMPNGGFDVEMGSESVHAGVCVCVHILCMCFWKAEEREGEYENLILNHPTSVRIMKPATTASTLAFVLANKQHP